MSEEKYYWKWKNTIIDFNTISDEKDEYSKYMPKKYLVFHYLGIPDEDIHEWCNGSYSSEYNTALRYAKELGLVEDYIDYEEIRYQLQQKENIIKELKERSLQYSKQIDNLLDIKEEVREYVNKMWLAKLTPDTVSQTKFELLEILDKEVN